VPLGAAATAELVTVAARLRRAGVRVDLAYGGRGLKGSMKAADRSGARYALVLGERDIEAGTIGVKDLVTGEQLPVPLDGVLEHLIDALG
jgi:histidyl-tRNA synthetase